MSMQENEKSQKRKNEQVKIQLGVNATDLEGGVGGAGGE